MIHNRTRGVARCIAFAVIAFTNACATQETMSETFTRDLVKAVGTLQPNDAFTLSDVRTASWTTLYIFPPYTAEAEVAARVASHSSKKVNTHGVSARDDINLMVFMNGTDVEMVVPMPRDSVDFALGGAQQPFTRATATFERLSQPGIVLAPKNK